MEARFLEYFVYFVDTRLRNLWSCNTKDVDKPVFQDLGLVHNLGREEHLLNVSCLSFVILEVGLHGCLLDMVNVHQMSQAVFQTKSLLQFILAQGVLQYSMLTNEEKWRIFYNPLALQLVIL